MKNQAGVAGSRSMKAAGAFGVQRGNRDRNLTYDEVNIFCNCKYLSSLIIKRDQLLSINKLFSRSIFIIRTWMKMWSSP